MSLHNIVAPFTDFYFDFISIGILLSDHAPTYTPREMGKWANGQPFLVIITMTLTRRRPGQGTVRLSGRAHKRPNELLSAIKRSYKSII